MQIKVSQMYILNIYNEKLTVFLGRRPLNGAKEQSKDGYKKGIKIQNFFTFANQRKQANAVHTIFDVEGKSATKQKEID